MLCYAGNAYLPICFDVLECAVMHGVLSAMWYSVKRFTEMSHEECCIVICA